jgi:hypothetical protein
VPRGHQKLTRQPPPPPPPPRLRRRTVVPEARARVRSPTLPRPGSPRPAGARWRPSRMAQRRPSLRWQENPLLRVFR